ncbi:MAG: methyltransferase domain-containing protein [Candidatus Omnitrophica bacterium]|nr:methyltransferase domain-containing protein [Candidatus Omnitrophota bacterium]
MAGYIETIYDENVRPRTEYPQQLCAHLMSRFQIPRGARILDAGCGRGDFLNGFQLHGLEVFGVDAEPASVKVNGAVVKCAELENGALPFTDNYFDVVFSKSVIEHLFNPEKFVSECRRVLKPGGRIIMMTPDWESTMKVFFDDYSHRQPYTRTALKDLLTMFKFREVSAEIFYQLPVVWRYPALKIVSRILQLIVPVTAKSPVKFIRWSVELMVLGTGIK